MDTQKVIIENKELRDERDRLRGWVSKLLDAKDDHVHVGLGDPADSTASEQQALAAEIRNRRA
jgi:hypothetical protein